MKLVTFNKAAKIVDELEELGKVADILMATVAKKGYRQEGDSTLHNIPFSFLVQTLDGPKEFIIKDNTYIWELWSQLVDYLGKAMEDKEQELADIKEK